MEVIDVHTHVCFVNDALKVFAEEHKRVSSFDGLVGELKKNGVSHAFAITENLKDATPIDGENVRSLQHPSVSWIAGINPFKAGKKELKATDTALSEGLFQGLKIYLGYYPVFPQDRVYEPFFKLAQKHDCPVFFHTGDTFGSHHLVKYAHPLNIDEVAVKYPGVKFVVCHFGNPWCLDAAELVYKNANVFADVSGFVVAQVSLWRDSHRLFNQISSALEYCGYDKLLYGTDWPLVDMHDYFRLIRSILPRRERKKVFAGNAKRLFHL